MCRSATSLFSWTTARLERTDVEQVVTTVVKAGLAVVGGRERRNDTENSKCNGSDFDHFVGW
jgi:hypothetical protein